MVEIKEFKYPSLKLKVWGDLACFTRPDMKAERMSYQVMTPSAARGILESVFWKPEFSWIIQKIEVLKPIKRISIRRNEIKNKIAEGAAKKWLKENKCDYNFLADENNTQRNTLALKNVGYIITANMILSSHVKNENIAKYRSQFRRRVEKGACYTRPYLGCREFIAYFDKIDGTEEPISLNEDLGRMLFDINYKNQVKTPHFFQARLINGVLEVPIQKYNEIL